MADVHTLFCVLKRSDKDNKRKHQSMSGLYNTADYVFQKSKVDKRVPCCSETI